MPHHIVAIDQGTTGSTVLVLAIASDGAIQVVGRGYAEFPQHFPKPGWVEHDLEELWRSVQNAFSGALFAAGIDASSVQAIGITNQRETTGVWRDDGTPIHRAIVWQDRRTAPHTERLRRDGYESLLRERTGLVADPYFSGTKLAWLLDTVEGARSESITGSLRFGTMDTWLVWKLSSAP